MSQQGAAGAEDASQVLAAAAGGLESLALGGSAGGERAPGPGARSGASTDAGSTMRGGSAASTTRRRGEPLSTRPGKKKAARPRRTRGQRAPCRSRRGRSWHLQEEEEEADDEKKGDGRRERGWGKPSAHDG
ncbi:unnamed protein product [Prorocentrum cordatum]|uniref:Uncharacterized protein n=1 Tax=Prorocentrum cordatum TaxID=2364126 RepID=A0ABN9YEU2_9DINO|nr:unnamed protein product [Polarella glacialis]